MGSTQSAWRIQPSSGSGCAGVPADLSCSPFLLTPPPALPPPLASPPVPLPPSPRVEVGGRGRGWGRLGTAPQWVTSRRQAYFHRSGVLRPAPGWLGRLKGKVARWGDLSSPRPAHPPRVLQPPGSRVINRYAPNIGAPQYIRQLLTAVKEEIDSNTIIGADINTSSTPMDRSS